MAVRIPQYQQQTTVAASTNMPRARGAEIDQSFARANLQLAGAIGQAAETYATVQAQLAAEKKRQENEDAKVYAANSIAQGAQSAMQEFVRRQDEAPPGAPDFAQGMNDWLDEYEETAVSQAPNDTSKTFMRERFLALRTDMTQRALSFETDERRKWRANTGKEAIDAVAATMAVDPTRLPTALAEQRAVIASYDIPQEQKRALLDYANETVSTAAVLGEVERDPMAARQKLAARLGVDEVEVAGPALSADVVWRRMIHQESRGKQSAVSPKGATGIAQIMPETGPEAARLANLPWDPVKFKNDAHYNAALGRAYFDEQLKTYQSPALAAAAYNAGPGAVNDWIKRFGDPRAGQISVAEFAKKIPFKETREYVAIVAAPGSPTVQQVVDADDAGMKTGSQAYDLLPIPKVVSLLGQVSSTLDKQQAQFRSYVSAREADDMAAFGDGKQPPAPLSVGEFVGAFGEVDGMRRWQAYQSAQGFASDMSGFKTMPPDQIVATVKAKAPKPGEGYAAQAAQYGNVVRAATAVIQQRAEDPQQFAMDNGLSDSQPINFQDAEAMGAELGRRVGSADTMSTRYGTRYSLLTKGEVAQMSGMLGQMTAPEKAEFLQQIRGSTPDRAYQSVMGQLRPDSPVTALAGSIMTQSGPVTVKSAGWIGRAEVIRPERVAMTILAGEDLLNPSKGDKAQDGKPKFPMPSDNDMRAVWLQVTGDAYRGSPETEAATYQAYRAFYAAQAQATGKNDGTLQDDIAEMAARAVTGGVLDVNGRSVVTPWGMPEDTFIDALRADYEAQAKRAGVTADFDAVEFQTTGNGVYLPSLGTTPLPFRVTVGQGVPRSGAIGGSQ